MEKKSISKDVKFALKKALPIMPGYVVMGIGFGVMMSDAGYSWWWSLLMCLCILGGSMQYAAVGILSAGTSVITTAIITFTIHARLFIYSLSMLDRYRNTGRVKPYLIYGLVDETYSIVSSDGILPDSLNRKVFYAFVTFFDQLWWIIGCVAGGLLGPVIPFNTAGVDFAMTALFIVLFIEQFAGNRGRRPALLGLGVTFACLMIFGESIFLIPAMIIITAVLVVFRRKITTEEGSV